MRNDLLARYWKQRQGGDDGPVPRLPYGYTEIGAVHQIFNSKAYMDTGLQVDSSDEWIVTCRRTGSTGNYPVIGGGYSKTDSNMCLWLNAETNLVEFTYGDGGSNSYKVTTTDYNVSEWHTYRMKLSTGDSWIDGNYIGRPASLSSVPNPSSLVLFGCWRGSSLTSRFEGAVSEAVIIRNGVKSRHYIPCIRNDDAIPGFYDLCGSISSVTNTSFYRHNQTSWISYKVTYDVQVTEESPTYGFLVQSLFHDVTADWGDGVSETFTDHNATTVHSHTYAAPGIYTVSLDVPYSTDTLCLGGQDEQYNDKLVSISSFEGYYVPFKFCFVATNLVLPFKVFRHCTYVDNQAFVWCLQMDWTELPPFLTKFEYRAFYGCRKLAITKLPDHTQGEISSEAFRNSNAVALSSIPEGVTSIKDYAFRSCTGITSLTLPGTITSLTSMALYGCDNLLTVNVPWSEGDIANAPWGITHAVINYNYTP